MRKVKSLLLVTMLAMVLCACGSSAKEQTAGTDASVVKTEVTPAPAEEATPEPTVEPTPEPTQEPTPVPLIDGEVVCLPEMKTAYPEDWMMQVGYSIIKMDGSMSFSEVLKALENSGLGIKITDESGDEFNMETRSFWPDAEIMVNIHKDDKVIMRVYGANRTQDYVMATDARMTLEKITLLEINIWEYVYFCKGIPMTGKDLTYGTVMEMFAEYVPTMITQTNSNAQVFKDIRFNPTMADGSTKDCVLRFCFESEEDAAACLGVSYRELEDYEK